MKGIIFTELLEMAESTFSVSVVEDVLDSVELPSGGSYTSVGTYDHEELLAIVGQLSAQTGVPAGELVSAYGRYLFGRFTVLYPAMFADVECALDFIESVESHIHVEVRKLYSDAELPTIETTRTSDGDLEVFYRSRRPLADVAEALICGCIEHFGSRFDLQRTDENTDTEFRTRFLVTQRVGAVA